MNASRGKILTWLQEHGGRGEISTPDQLRNCRLLSGQRFLRLQRQADGKYVATLTPKGESWKPPS